jgi:hypothetical protein
MVLHVGDVAYADGNADVWDSFMEEIEPIASRVPYMVGIGKHLTTAKRIELLFACLSACCALCVLLHAHGLCTRLIWRPRGGPSFQWRTPVA